MVGTQYLFNWTYNLHHSMNNESRSHNLYKRVLQNTRLCAKVLSL